MAGKVYLTGAGPGDYRLMTLAAVRALGKADVVVYDRLADERVLRFASPTAKLIFAGKQVGKHTLSQSEINQLLVAEAKEGKCVCRLKGGDPFVFGRGGEEALTLEKNGISFEIIPGVTSAVAVPAYAGIPVTHRGIAASVAIVTGHEDPDKEDSAINWEKLATAVDTLVFLMGIGNLPRITGKLLENGLAPDTPAAFIRWGTRPEQKTVVTTLGEAVAVAGECGLRPPAIFIVGEVVSLRGKIKWFEQQAERPLLGKSIVVTRSREQASQLTAGLEELGARVAEIPLIKIVPPADNYAELDKAIAELKLYNWVIFTSVNGVKQFFSRLTFAGKDTRAVQAKVAAIGAATAEALKNNGIVADVVPEEFRAEGLLAAMTEKINPGERILLARAAEAREVLPAGLRKLGAKVDVVSAYETVATEVSEETVKLFQEQCVDYVTFASSSTVEKFASAFGEDRLKGIKAVCIGPITAENCRKYGAEPYAVAEQYTVQGLIDTLVRYAGEEAGNGEAVK